MLFGLRWCNITELSRKISALHLARHVLIELEEDCFTIFDKSVNEISWPATELKRFLRISDVDSRSGTIDCANLIDEMTPLRSIRGTSISSYISLIIKPESRSCVYHVCERVNENPILFRANHSGVIVMKFKIHSCGSTPP